MTEASQKGSAMISIGVTGSVNGKYRRDMGTRQSTVRIGRIVKSNFLSPTLRSNVQNAAPLECRPLPLAAVLTPLAAVSGKR